MKAKRCTFRNATVQVDGHTYVACRFEHCRLVYAGGELPSMIGCEFERCRWSLDGAAARTLRLMKAMAGRGGPLRELVERSLGLVPGTPPPTGQPRGRASADKTRLGKSLH